MKKSYISFFLLLFSLFFSAQTYAATPTLLANTTQVCYEGTAKPLLVITSGSGKTSYVSGVIGNPTDPAATKGILFTSANSPTEWTITSSKTAVVPLANITMTLVSGDQYVCKIVPAGVGYSKITVAAKNSSGSSTAYTIQYAASAASANGANTTFHTNIADASGACAIDDNYMFVADDETNLLRLYNRKNSGQSLYSADITSTAGGTSSEEFDLEGSSISSSNYNSGKRIYWIASLGNSKSGGLKPYRDRVIATDISGSGATATLSVKSYSTKMRAALISWGDAKSWNFTASAASGMIPKRIDGFNVEGLTITNEGEKAYVGFRAPCVPIQGTTPTSSNRKYAILAPVSNFETMMNVSSSSSITPTIGDPILFDFAGLGIRSIERVGTRYVIVAGLFEGGGTPAVYLWDGVVPANPGQNPITTSGTHLTKLPLNLSDLVQASSDGGLEGHPEALLCEQTGNDLNIHLICDNGTIDYYGDGTEAKALSYEPFKKFRMDNFVYNLGTTDIKSIKSNSFSYFVYDSQVNVSGLDKESNIKLMDISGKTVVNIRTQATEMVLPLPRKGVYLLTVSTAQGTNSVKVLNK